MQHRLTRGALLLATLPLLALALGCSDGTGPSSQGTAVAGTWVGSYTVAGSDVVFDYTLIFFKGDSMQAVDGLDPASHPIAVGHWSREGATIRAIYSYPVGAGTYSLEGVLGNSESDLTGTWGAGESTAGGGGFSVQRH
jgi:hypothetical protein